MLRILCSIGLIGLCVTLLAVAADEEKGNFEQTLTEMVERLGQQLDKTQKVDEKPALEAAIDSLVRLRDRDKWPVVNTTSERGKLQNTSWISEPNRDGYRERLHFSEKEGHWQRNRLALPFTFTWNVEADRVRFTYASGYKGYQESSSTQIVDQTYRYSLEGEKLIIKREKENMRWEREKRE